MLLLQSTLLSGYGRIPNSQLCKLAQALSLVCHDDSHVVYMLQGLSLTDVCNICASAYVQIARCVHNGKPLALYTSALGNFQMELVMPNKLTHSICIQPY